MAVDDFKGFGTMLRRYRRAARLTQETLAERAHISVETISNLERGVRHAPRADTLDLLADALDLAGDERRTFYDAARVQVLARDTRPINGNEAALPRAANGRLPTPPTPLIGRQRELAMVHALLHAPAEAASASAEERARLLTLVGPPGVGKTRLGIAVARRCAEVFRDGAWFVALAPLAAAELVPSAIAHTLGVREDGPLPLHERLRDHLSARHLLIVLDNFEHLAGAAPFLAELLAACPEVTLLVTSRTPVGIRAEQQCPVAPLPLPDPAQLPPLDKLAENPAVALFVARARAVRPDFSLSAENAADVAAICCRLDGLPLAIELAAARSRVFRPRTLLARLDHRLRLLTQGPPDLPMRQRTLRGTLAWSYELLSPEEQALFRRLSIFAGSASLKAIESVCGLANDALTDDVGGGESQDNHDAALSTLSALVDRSLVLCIASSEEAEGEHDHVDGDDSATVAVAPDDGPRFRMLETLREYGTELLSARGELAELQQRHAAYYLMLCETAYPYFKGPGQAAWLVLLNADQPNVQVALEWFEQHDDCERGLRLAAASWRIWYARGALSEARRKLDKLLTLDAEGSSVVPVMPATRANALNIAGLLAYTQADYQVALERYQQSLALYRVLGKRQRVGAVLNNLATIAQERGDYAHATELHEESLAIKREVGDQREIGIALNNLGTLARLRGDYARAIKLLEEGMALYRAAGDLTGSARALGNLGNVWREQGDCVRARALLEETLALFHRLGDAHGIAYSLGNLAEVSLQEGDFVRAEPLAEEALAQLRTLSDWRAAFALIILARIACERSEWQRAKALYQESVALTRQMQMIHGADACLEGLAVVAASEGKLERAAQLLGAAAAVREQHAIHLPNAERARADRICAALRATLPDERFDAAWSVGHTMPLEQAIAEALGEASAALTEATVPEPVPAAVPEMAPLRVHPQSGGHNGRGG